MEFPRKEKTPLEALQVEKDNFLMMNEGPEESVKEKGKELLMARLDELEKLSKNRYALGPTHSYSQFSESELLHMHDELEQFAEEHGVLEMAHVNQ